MNREEFFEKKREGCVSEEQYLIELLRSRGFLLEEVEGKYMVSDNSHAKDAEYLDTLLKKYNFGYVLNNEITIFSNIKALLFEDEFRENIKIGSDPCRVNREWRYFKSRRHGYKAEVEMLEPYIARYVKAVSACCVLTVGSCDGNHPEGREMYIMTPIYGSAPWHKLICKKCLVNRFDIHWINRYTGIRFTPETKYDTYYEVNRAAEFLYANRKLIREIKNEAFSGIKNSFLKTHSPEEIEKEFIGRASELFDNVKFC